MPDRTARILPVLLSGGGGSRLWPLSRPSQPKHLLALTSERTLLQETALRVSDAARFEALTVITGGAHVAGVREQLRDVGVVAAKFVIEPTGRDTGPAAAIAALLAEGGMPEALVLLMPADHRIVDTEAFQEAVDVGAAAAERGQLVLFGMAPDRPATGYGYIQVGAASPYANGVFAVEAFAEKPDTTTAEGYLARGGYLWNSGIFLFSARVFLAELEIHGPAILRHARAALAAASQEGDSVTLDAESFANCPAVSIDRAVMERTRLACVVPADFGWTDVGSWSALWEIGERDRFDNVVVGDVLVTATSGSYVRSSGPLVATLGVSNLIVIVTPDAVLVADKSRDQDVKALVERLKAGERGSR